MTPSTTGVAFGLVAWVVCASAVPARAQCPNPTARIVRIDSQVEHKAASAGVFVPARANLDVCRGDAIRTGERSRATIVFVDNTRLVIDQNTEWIVREPDPQGRTLIDLLKGAILFFTRQPRSLNIKTPFVNATVEGTEFLVRVEGDRTLVTVFEGRVALSNRAGSLTLADDESGESVEGRAPERRVVVRPRDAVQWALYYPRILEGDSLAQLDRIPEAQRDGRFHVRRASVLLDAGRLDEARAELDRAVARSPGDGEAHALRAVIAVALNDRESALASGREAVAKSPTSAASRVALSYALQADFQLEAARDELLQAVTDQPKDAGAWARLAELWLSLGYVDRSKEAAERAVSFAPAQARAHMVLGFAALARIDIGAAEAAFEQAIALEPGSPLARLGLGLAKIRKGRLAEGRQDLEIAVALNPDDPIARSYLGKAYFDERREPLPGPQFERAKQIDPRDATPWYYDAIRKQTLNRPVEALEDLERSIALNDDRAVYRSRFLLDQDLAARSASLGRIYRDLGFEQRALVEAWRSIDYDGGDYSGHRFLADTYSALPRHEVARVSELLQAQLLQPLSLTPVPPRLGETDLFILESAGPDEPAFNEFNPLFNRNRVAAQVSAAFGNRSVFGDEATVSGIWNRLSFSVGQFHYDSDGFRVNNQQGRDIFNAFVQAQLSPATSVQAEFRSDQTDTGDLNLLFNPEDFSADQAIHVESSVMRVGMRHAFSPRSQVIASVYFGSRDSDLASSVSQLEGSGALQLVSRTDSWTAEIRHLFRAGRLGLTSGFGHFQSDRDRTETLDLELPFPPFSVSFSEQFSDDPSQTNLYAYATLDLPERVTVTIGASGDFYDSQLFDRKQFNPKAGVTWKPLPSTEVRVAVVRTLHRALVTSQTIEPTQIAGFNQFFADVEGEDAVRYGLALDQKVGRRWFAGAEMSWRDLNVPVSFITDSGPLVERFDRGERLGRAYLYWAPRRDATVTAEYIYERFDRNEGSSGEENILDLRTHRVPVGLRYFAPAGWYANLKGTFVNQRGTFAGLAFAPSGEDRFWVVDASIGYRLPKRYGRLALEIRNLFDEEFRFQDTDPGNPVVKPGRLALFTLTLGV